jgi:hypothetical protein
MGTAHAGRLRSESTGVVENAGQRVQIDPLNRYAGVVERIEPGLFRAEDAAEKTADL